MDKSSRHTNNEHIMKIPQEVYYGDKKRVFCAEKEMREPKESTYSCEDSLEQN